MPRPTPTKLAALAVLVLALLAAGCGGGGASKEEFQVEVVAARDRVDSALEQVTNASSVDDLLARLRIAAAEVRSAATDVSEAEAPDDLEDEKRKLANTLRAFSQELAATVTTLETLEGAAAETKGLDFENWTKTQAVLEELRKAGVQVRPLERH
jgi:F0F1-type ATP synthase membrane subunit b/b'